MFFGPLVSWASLHANTRRLHAASAPSVAQGAVGHRHTARAASALFPPLILIICAKMLRHLSRCVAGPVAAASAGAATLATALLSHADGPAASASASAVVPKVVHELSFSIAPSVVGDFSFWLTSYLKEVLEHPGMLGAKVLASATPPAAIPGVVFVLGGPGAGKGTQSALIVEKYGYTHLSAGDLLRAERKSGSAQGHMIDEYIKEGKIVPVEVTVTLLMNAMKADGGARFLVDGFPRNTNNLSGWQQVTGDSLQVGGVLFYDCPEDVMEARLIERGKTSGRADDNIESIKKRFHTYQNETTPILAYYEHQQLMHKIDGTRDVDAVWADTMAAVAAMEGRFEGKREAVCAHVYASADKAMPVAELEKRVAAAAAARFGDKVSVSARGLKVEASLKAYDLNAAPAFD